MNYMRHFNVRVRAEVVLALVIACGLTGSAWGQSDPGPRGGPPAVGGPLPGLGPTEITFFNAARGRFQEVDSVSGTIADAPPGIQNGTGLGPRFNLNQCSGCHAQPAVGGSSPPTNPQVAVATLDGAQNTVPSFVNLHGPVREARFINNPDGTPDGGVHDLFVISGRSDARGCHITQPNFRQALNQGNVIFRIPTPVFGGGLVENVPDNNLEATTSGLASLQNALGIASGVFNHSGNDGTITRFGWKAQNKSLLIFAGEAYNAEQGVTSEAFPNERETDPNCQFNALPEDVTNLVNPNTSGFAPSDFSSDVVNFGAFMRLSAGPTPAPATPSTTRGQRVFSQIGCQACHAQTQKTAQSVFTGQSLVSFNPFSDFALHDMGEGLEDNISQGGADGDQFRTAPLWGLGQRIFFLHDGRTSDLIDTIQAHQSGSTRNGNASEANGVVDRYNALSESQKQDLLNFLRSL